eukprot:SAG31_NODE_16282_length_715_cov_1.074675_1_plen_182_part_01
MEQLQLYGANDGARNKRGETSADILRNKNGGAHLLERLRKVANDRPSSSPPQPGSDGDKLGGTDHDASAAAVAPEETERIQAADAALKAAEAALEPAADELHRVQAALASALESIVKEKDALTAALKGRKLSTKGKPPELAARLRNAIEDDYAAEITSATAAFESAEAAVATAKQEMEAANQ